MLDSLFIFINMTWYMTGTFRFGPVMFIIFVTASETVLNFLIFTCILRLYT